MGHGHRPSGSRNPARFSEVERMTFDWVPFWESPLRDGGSRSPGGNPSLMLISPQSGHRGRTAPRQHPKAPLPAAGSASCTPRAGPAGGTTGPAWEGQPASPQNQPAGQAGSRGAGGPVFTSSPRAPAGGGPRGPSLDTGGGWEPRWPCLGHRCWGGPCGPTLGGSWTALPWTQVGGGNSGGPALDTGRVLGDGSRTALARLSEHRRVSWESHGRFMNQVSAHACVLKTWEDGD